MFLERKISECWLIIDGFVNSHACQDFVAELDIQMILLTMHMVPSKWQVLAETV